MLWGATLRSPHPARGSSVDRHRAGARHPRRPRRADPRGRARPQDLRPGARRPAGARDRPGPLPGRAGRDRRRRPPRDGPAGVRARSRSSTRCSTPLTRPASARDGRRTRRSSHAGGNVLRHVRIRHGDPDATPPTSSSPASTRSACRTRRSSARSPASPCPTEDGGVDLYIATQWLHVDRDQVAACLGLPPRRCG